MKKLYFLFLFSSVITYGQTQIGLDIDGLTSSEYAGMGVSLSNDGTTLAIGSPGTIAGTVRVYKNIFGSWIQIGSDIDGEAIYDNSGFSVSLSDDGTILAIGAQGNNNYTGSIRVYKNVLGTWTQIGSDIDGAIADVASGFSISLSSDGTILAIDEGGYNNNTGAVRVYKNIIGTWTQIGTNIIGEGVNDFFGNSVSLSSDGSILAIGAPSVNDFIGYGYVSVYQNISNIWTQIGTNIVGEEPYDWSGYCVSLSSDGSILVIGAPYNDGNGVDSGHVRVYQNLSGVWTQLGLDINGEAADDYSGMSVSLSNDGTILAIGASSNDGNGIDSGHVRVYKNISGVWSQIGVDINGESIYDRCSYSPNSVSLSNDGTILAIGAPYNDENGADSGHVRVFDLSALLNSNTFVLDNFSIYPNPTSDILNITLENNLTLEKVNIYNTLGQLIKTESKLQINISSLAKGNYFVEVITNQGKATKTIIIE